MRAGIAVVVGVGDEKLFAGGGDVIGAGWNCCCCWGGVVKLFAGGGDVIGAGWNCCCCWGGVVNYSLEEAMRNYLLEEAV